MTKQMKNLAEVIKSEMNRYSAGRSSNAKDCMFAGVVGVAKSYAKTLSKREAREFLKAVGLNS